MVNLGALWKGRGIGVWAGRRRSVGGGRVVFQAGRVASGGMRGCGRMAPREAGAMICSRSLAKTPPLGLWAGWECMPCGVQGVSGPHACPLSTHACPLVPRQTDGAPKQRRRGRSGHDRDGEARVTGLNTSRTCAVTAGRSGQNTSRTCTAAARSPLASDSDNLDPTNGGARVKGPDPACVAGRPRRRPTEEPRKPGSGPRRSPGHRPRLRASRRVLPGKP